MGGDIAADWERFQSEWTNYEVATDICEGSAKKRAAVFLACIGSAAHSVFRTFRFDNADDKSDVSKIIEAFQKHCIGETNVTYERYIFHQRVQQPGEIFDDFLADLRKMAKTCAFEQLEDSLIRDRLIIGIRDDPTRRRLLQQKKLSLSDTIDACRASEATSRRLRVMGGSDKVEALTHSSSTSSSVSSHGRRTASKSRDRQNREPSNIRRCKYCDRQHGASKESCPAFRQKCRKCGKMNHFEVVCKSAKLAQIKQQRQEVCQIDGEELLTLKDGDRDRAYCRLKVNGTSVQFLLDCGATVNVLPLTDATAIDPKLSMLRPAASRLTMFDDTELKTLGMLTANVQHPLSGKRQRMDFYVTTKHDRAILGMKACREMDLISVNTSNICSVVGVDASSSVVPSTSASPSQKVDESPLTKEKIIELYADIFTGVGQVDGEIHLDVDRNVPPVQLPPRRLPIAIKDRVKAELDEMCRNGIIEPVNEPSSWISALLVVHKPNNKLRIAIDPRPLNLALKRCHYPMPTIDDVLPLLTKAKVFSTVDVTQGFNHLRLDRESAALTTFQTPFGRYRWLRLATGISPAPELFQRKMHELLAGLVGVACVADDILCYGCGATLEEARIDHDRNMIALLNRCRERDLHLNPAKLQVDRQTTTYMGHELTSEGLRADKRKIAAVKDMPPPTDRPALLRLLGMAQYLAKFVPNYSEVTAPLRDLLPRDVEFRWDDFIHGKALRQLKEMLTTAPVLRYYDVNKPVKIQCDASSSGIGAVLLQEGQPIEYASRKMSSSERDNYSQLEKEMAAIVFAMERFHTYVYGKEGVMVESDHKPLQTIVKKSLLAVPRRLMKMLLKLQAYSFDVVYKPGSQMVIADALSRAYLPDEQSTEYTEDIVALADQEQREALLMVASPATIDLIKTAAERDDQYQLLKRQISIGWPTAMADVPATLREFATFADELAECDGLVFKGQRVVIPIEARAEILQRVHSSHIGVNGCIRRAKEAVFYPGLTADIKKMVSSCDICQAVQMSAQKEPLMSHATPTRPWEKIGCDVFTLRNQDYLVTVDYLSGFFEVDRLPSKRVSDIIYCLKAHFARYGLPLEVCSDNSPFNSAEFRRFAHNYDFVHTTSSPHFPRSNGRAEAAVKCAKRLMEKAAQDHADYFLALLAWRNTPAEQLNQLSPVQIMCGRRTRTNLPSTDKLLASAHGPTAHDALAAAKVRQALYYNRGARERPPLAVGDTVRTRWDSKDDWRKAEVVKVLPHRSYYVRFEDGSTRRRTSKHVRFSRETPLVIHDETELPATKADVQPSIAVNSATGNTVRSSADNGSRQAPSVDTRTFTRSGRRVVKPTKYADYICT